MKVDWLFDTRTAVTISWLTVRKKWIDEFTHGLLINIHILMRLKLEPCIISEKM